MKSSGRSLTLAAIEKRPSLERAATRKMRRFQTFIELRHHLAASNAQSKRVATVEALQRAVAMDADLRGPAQFQCRYSAQPYVSRERERVTVRISRSDLRPERGHVVAASLYLVADV
jgi:hypothetical protein